MSVVANDRLRAGQIHIHIGAASKCTDMGDKAVCYIGDILQTAGTTESTLHGNLHITVDPSKQSQRLIAQIARLTHGQKRTIGINKTVQLHVDK